MKRSAFAGDVCPVPPENAPLRGVPNHALLVATVAVRQAGTRTAQLAGRIGRASAHADPVDALVATLLHADTAAATRTLGGSFHPEVARVAPGKDTGKPVNPALTLAF